MTQKDLKRVNEILTHFQVNALIGDRKVITNKADSYEYQHKINEELYLVIQTEEDSYGENEQVSSIFFAKPVKIEVTQFEKF